MADIHGSPGSAPQVPASGFAIQAPYAPGSPDPVLAGGDADAGGRDDVSGTVAGAAASAEARYREMEADTHGQGSTIGDLMDLPPYGTAGTVAGSYYDPPRSY